MIKVVLFKRSLKILSGLEGHAQSSQIFNLWSKINDSLFCQFTSLLIIFYQCIGGTASPPILLAR